MVDGTLAAGWGFVWDAKPGCNVFLLLPVLDRLEDLELHRLYSILSAYVLHHSWLGSNVTRICQKPALYWCGQQRRWASPPMFRKKREDGWKCPENSFSAFPPPLSPILWLAGLARSQAKNKKVKPIISFKDFGDEIKTEGTGGKQGICSLRCPPSLCALCQLAGYAHHIRGR